MSIQSRDQLRAKHAMEKLESRNISNMLSDKDIKSAVSGLPAMIHMNGLGHAFAFYLSDEAEKKPERAWLVDTVFDWLNNHSGVYKGLDNQNLTPLKAVTLSDLTTHQIAQQEAQAYLLWLKKFARALLTSNHDDSDSDSDSDQS